MSLFELSAEIADNGFEVYVSQPNNKSTQSSLKKVNELLQKLSKPSISFTKEDYKEMGRNVADEYVASHPNRMNANKKTR